MALQYNACGETEWRVAVQIATRTEYEKVIQETESAYVKILESSQTLLTVLKRESVNIQKKRYGSAMPMQFRPIQASPSSHIIHCTCRQASS